ncbi:MAG: STAS domain-containing protein [Fibrobacterota bacterium]
MPSLKIQTKTLGDFTVYSLNGELIVSTILSLKQRVLDDLTQKRSYFAMNLSQVSQIDSSGMALLNNIKKKADEAGGHLVLFSLSKYVLDNLTQTGLLSNLVVVRDEDEFRDTFVL